MRIRARSRLIRASGRAGSTWPARACTWRRRYRTCPASPGFDGAGRGAASPASLASLRLDVPRPASGLDAGRAVRRRRRMARGGRYRAYPASRLRRGGPSPAQSGLIWPFSSGARAGSSRMVASRFARGLVIGEIARVECHRLSVTAAAGCRPREAARVRAAPGVSPRPRPRSHRRFHRRRSPAGHTGAGSGFGQPNPSRRKQHSRTRPVLRVPDDVAPRTVHGPGRKQDRAGQSSSSTANHSRVPAWRTSTARASKRDVVVEVRRRA